MTTVPFGQNGWIPDSTREEERNILPLPGSEPKFLGHPACILNHCTSWATSAPYSCIVRSVFFGRTLSCNMSLSVGTLFIIHSHRWQYFAFLPPKLNHISHLLHITWSGVLGCKLGRWYLWLHRKLSHTVCILRSSKPNKCSPSLCISLTTVLFYKLNDLITHLYSGFHINTPHPIFTPQCSSRWHILFCTETGMHQKMTNVSACVQQT